MVDMKSLKSTIKKLLIWLDNNLLFSLSVFLLVFIPLYPKLPLADLLPGYIVRLRLEDLFILFSALIYLVWWLRKKANPLKNPLFWLIIGYLMVGLVSGLTAVFVVKTIPMQPLHIAKWAFHFIRRIEYMFMLFLLFDAVKTKNQMKVILVSLLVVIVGATIYGFGQKYYQWPVYSTMNREFSKGWRLVLTEHARVPSTFAGHYDLAAYLVLLLPVTLVMAIFSANRLIGNFGWVAFVSGYTLLILTASRASFISYVVSTAILFGAMLLVKNWRFVLPRFIGVVVFSTAVFLTFGDLSGRFAHVINLSGVRGFVQDKIFRMDKNAPKNYLALTDQLALVADKTDVPPIPFQPGAGSGQSGNEDDQLATESALPPDVYEEIPLPSATTSAAGKLSITYSPRSYSDAAFAYGLSSAIRFDALWPRAIAGFKRNPLLGTGYSTLTKVQVTDFTEAESTDNDYLRALGETGILGLGLFFGTVVYMIYWLFRVGPAKSLFERGIQFSIIAGTVGLLVNASYIDVFEASKVAFTFWGIVGVGMAIEKIARVKNSN